MSVQFGKWDFEGQPPAPSYIEKVSVALAPYGPDSDEAYSEGGLNMLYRAFHTTRESRHETQPHVSPSGAVITFDGRLDNRPELISEFCKSLTASSTDVAIVAAAYERWGATCLGKLIGDWALSIWNPRDRSVVLAKDPIGTKHLYYSLDDKHLTWSTILDPLVLFAGKPFEICEEYIAEWFTIIFPAAHLTPYVGIHSVPPSSSVLLRPGTHVISKYWDFDPGKRIRYRTDTEYEEHFRTALATAVQRRLRSDRPVLAELSGGMDSSSIVCMADIVIACGDAETPRLDTITWYDNSDPNWGEYPYFIKVEEKRGRVGCHIDFSAQKRAEVGSQRSLRSDFEGDRFAATPIPNNVPCGVFEQHPAYMKSQGNRVTLSGIGGGDATGDGVPTPTAELQDLLVRARFVTLAHQLKAWAAKMRKPCLPMLWEAVRGFFPASVPRVNRPADWFDPGFVRRNRTALCRFASRVKLFGPLPTFQDNIDKMNANRRFLAYWGLRSELRGEVRYPYFDRDFLEFMYAIPREQIVRVGQRRSLMRRALVGIVPGELLNRKKKAISSQVPSKRISAEWPTLAEIGQHMISRSIGIVDPDGFWEELQKARQNQEVSVGSLIRTLTLETWLRHLATQGVLTKAIQPTDKNVLRLFRPKISKRRLNVKV